MTWPAGWREVTLGMLEAESRGVIQTGPFGSQLHASDYSCFGTPVVMPTNIRDLRISTNGIVRVSDEHVERLARHRLRTDDIVYSRRGDVEKCALVTDNQEGWLCGTGCLLVRVQGPTVDTRCLAYLLSLPSTRAWISQHAVGATMPNLNTDVLREVPVVLPLIQDQRGIAATFCDHAGEGPPGDRSFHGDRVTVGQRHLQRLTASPVHAGPKYMDSSGDVDGLAGIATQSCDRFSVDLYPHASKDCGVGSSTKIDSWHATSSKVINTELIEQRLGS